MREGIVILQTQPVTASARWRLLLPLFTVLAIYAA
jgi:hypothetical protein